MVSDYRTCRATRVASLIAVLATGCSGSGADTATETSSVSSSSSGGASSSSSAGAGGAATGTLTVLAVSVTYVGGVRSNPPAVAAHVAIDLPGGGTAEAGTADAGHATFTGIDWSKGSANVAGYLDETRLTYGNSGVDPSNFDTFPAFVAHPGADLVLYLFERTSAQYAEILTLNLENKAAPGNQVAAFTTTGPAGGGTGSSLMLEVASGQPYTLTTREATLNATDPRQPVETTVRWAQTSEPAPASEFSTVDFDLASGGTTLAPKQAHAHIVLPGGDSGPFGSFSLPLVGASAGAGSAPFALASASLTTAHDAFDVTAEYVDTPGMADAFVDYGVTTASNEYSLVAVIGAPTQAVVMVDGLLPPPVPPSTIRLKDPITVSGADPSAFTRVILTDSTGVGLEEVDILPGATTVQLPTAPAAAAGDQPSLKYVLLESVASPNLQAALWSRVAGSQYVPVEAP